MKCLLNFFNVSNWKKSSFLLLSLSHFLGRWTFVPVLVCRLRTSIVVDTACLFFPKKNYIYTVYNFIPKIDIVKYFDNLITKHKNMKMRKHKNSPHNRNLYINQINQKDMLEWSQKIWLKDGGLNMVLVTCFRSSQDT